MTKNIWSSDVRANLARHNMPQGKFLESTAGEILTAVHKVTLEASILELADATKAVFTEMGLTAILKSGESYWIGVDVGDEAVAIIRNETSDDEGIGAPASTSEADILVPVVGSYLISVTGQRATVLEVMKRLKAKFEHRKYAKVKWWCQGRHGPTYRTTYLDKPETTLHPEFYPDLIGNPETYIDNYLKSPEAVLLMQGAPGTGKTTFLRHMVHSRSLSAMVVFDEDLMKSDDVFQKFLFDPENDVLIIEDADTILGDRELENNKLMSRFLNISDGLIKLPKKKLIFTTNINDFNKVDQALMRPGRCFDVMRTRALDLDEAVRAAKAAGLPEPTERKTYTVAELFNQGRKAQARRIGFLGAA